MLFVGWGPAGDGEGLGSVLFLCLCHLLFLFLFFLFLNKGEELFGWRYFCKKVWQDRTRGYAGRARPVHLT